MNYSNTYSYKNSLVFNVGLIVFVLASIELVKYFNSISFELLVGIDVALILLFLSYRIVQDIPTVLLFVNILLLVILNNTFHYSLSYTLLQDIPLLFLLLVWIWKNFYTGRLLSFRTSYLFKPVLLFFLYFSLALVIGIIRYNITYFAFDEYYHLLYFVFSIVIFHFIKERKLYEMLFIAIAIITFIVSLEYCFIWVTTPVKRIATFQAELFPFVSGIVFSYLLLNKNNFSKVLLGSFFLIFIILGLLISLTRTLWISTFISVFIVYLLYLLEKKSTRRIKWYVFLSIIFLVLSVVFLKKNSQQPQLATTNLQQRTQSIANPSEDLSFLMRLEIGYYVVSKFIESPIFGSGLGDYVNYKVLNTTREKIYFPDSSWLFFLWKGGLVGFCLFGWLFFRLLRMSYFVYTRSTNTSTKIIIASIISGVLSFAFSGLLNPTLNKYKYGIIFSVIIAYVEFEKTMLKNE